MEYYESIQSFKSDFPSLMESLQHSWKTTLDGGQLPGFAISLAKHLPSNLQQDGLYALKTQLEKEGWNVAKTEKMVAWYRWKSQTTGASYIGIKVHQDKVEFYDMRNANYNVWEWSDDARYDFW